jgi:hypothetical protein
MNWTRRDLLTAALSLSAGSYLGNNRAMAAPFAKLVKITAIKTMQIHSVNDGCPIRVESDAGLAGYGEAGISAKLARDRIELIAKGLIGEDPLAIERHFCTMSATQYPFMAHIPAVSGIDIAPWDLAGKIIGQPVGSWFTGCSALPQYATLKLVRQRALILLIVGIALFAQGPSTPAQKTVQGRADSNTTNNSSLEQRIAVIETKLDNLKTLDDRVSKLNDKIDRLNLQLAAISTKLEIIQWFGGAIGVLMIGFAWSSYNRLPDAIA